MHGVDDIAYRVDIRYRSLVVVIHDYAASFAQLDAHRFQAKIFRVRRSPGRIHHQIGIHRRAITQQQTFSPVPFLDTLHLGVKVEANVFLPEFTGNELAYIMIETAQE